MTKTLRVLFVALIALLFGQQIQAQVEVFNETFDNCAGKGGNDGKFSGITGNKDLSDELTDNPGWTGEKASAASECVSVGVSKTAGSVTTPALTKLSGNAVLTFRAAAWAKDATTLTLNIKDGGSLSETTVTLAKGEFQNYSVNIIGGTSDTKITFAGKGKSNRFFLDDVKIVSGSAEVNYNVYKKADAVVNGHKYLLVALRNDTVSYATPLSKKYGYLKTVQIYPSTDEIKVESNDDNSFTFTANGDGYDISDYQGRYYIQKDEYYSFNTQTDVPETQWTVTPNGDGTFRIEMNGYYMQFGQTGHTTFGVWQDAEDNTVQPMLYELVSGSTSTKKDAGLAFDVTSIEVEKGGTFTAPVLTYKTNATINYSSDNTKVATVSKDGKIELAGGEGTAVITAKSEENDEYAAGEATCTISVFTYKVYKKADAVVSGHQYLLVAQRDGNTYYAYPLKEDKAFGYLSTGKIEGSTDEVKVKSFYDDAFTFTANGDGYDINDHLGRYYVQQEEYKSFNTQADAPETQWTVTPNGDGTFRIEMNGYYMQFGQGTYTTFGVYTDAQENTVQPMLYELVSEPAPLADIKINEGEGFATAYRDAAFTVPEGLTAGIVTKVNNNKSLTVNYRYAAGDVVPAKTPVLVKGNAGTYKLEAAESTEVAPEGNLLHGSDAVDKDGKTFVNGTDVKYYILSKGDVDGKQVMGFFWAAENGAAVDYVEGKAFLAVDAASGAKLSEGFSLEGDATGIESVETKALKNTDAVYTIAGVRLNKKVNELTKGLYIMNGKKVIVK